MRRRGEEDSLPENWSEERYLVEGEEGARRTARRRGRSPENWLEEEERRRGEEG
uniref:Uncharacterized protein n=1 Tax=Helianthus annuus TaxID=4232 RepID=A0A251SDN1_HELAN